MDGCFFFFFSSLGLAWLGFIHCNASLLAARNGARTAYREVSILSGGQRFIGLLKIQALLKWNKCSLDAGD